MFNIQDPDAKISPDVRDRIEDLSNKLLDGVNDIAESPFEALQALAAVSAYIACEGFIDRKNADQAITVFLMAIIATIEQAELDGNTIWSQRVKH